MATTFTNQATLNYNGTAVQSNIAVGEVESVLSVSKQTAAESYNAGDKLTYVISVTNKSDTDATGLTVTDDLGTYVFNTGAVTPLTYVERSVQYFRDGAAQPAPAVSTVSGVAFSDISVPAGGDAMLIYEATVNEFAPLGADAAITNTVVVTGDAVCGVEASETIAAANGALLSMLKSVAPIPVMENGELTYTFRLENNGAQAVELTDNAVITDTFNPLLNDLSVTLDGTALAQGTGYTYDETTGAFSTAAGVLAIPAATYTQDAATGAWSTTPGTATLTVTGMVGTLCNIGDTAP